MIALLVYLRDYACCCTVVKTQSFELKKTKEIFRNPITDEQLKSVVFVKSVVSILKSE